MTKFDGLCYHNIIFKLREFFSLIPLVKNVLWTRTCAIVNGDEYTARLISRDDHGCARC